MRQGQQRNGTRLCGTGARRGPLRLARFTGVKNAPASADHDVRLCRRGWRVFYAGETLVGYDLVGYDLLGYAGCLLVLVVGV